MKPLRDLPEILDEAAHLLRAAGFCHHGTSMRGLTTYYRLPGRRGLLRLSDHRRAKDGDRTSLAQRADMPVVTTLTFRGSHLDRPGRMKIGDEGVYGAVTAAIGRYMIKSQREACGADEGISPIFGSPNRIT